MFVLLDVLHMPVWCTLAVVHWGINLHADGQCARSLSHFRRQLKLLKTGKIKGRSAAKHSLTKYQSSVKLHG